jgi:hypothetical protein
VGEKIIRDDSDFVETYCNKVSPSIYVAHARPLLSGRRRGVSIKWMRCISARNVPKVLQTSSI